ncbi:glycosyltransferase family 2 protein [Morganella morganii]|uniref:glycosyltransferase family 2 protein n=1 Tax=Morganella morganii TaxID=582 RepID=UPI003BA2B5FC
MTEMPKNKKHLISVIMPCYNAEKYIEESINSVLYQKDVDVELIIIDDHSTDETTKIISSIRDNRIKLITLNRNLGAGNARNIGLQNAKSKFIAFIDADDIWLSHKLITQINYLLAHPNVGVICTAYRFIDDHSELISGSVIPDRVISLDSYMRNTCIGCSTVLLNRDNITELEFSNIRLRQDTHLWITLLINKTSINGLDQYLVNYRIRKNQISGNKINAAIKTLKLYWGFKQIPISKRIINYIFYAFNGVSKRLKKDI